MSRLFPLPPACLLSLRVCLLLCLLAPTAYSAAGREETRPNFIIIVLDDWGWQESGAYGNPRIQTPNIDRLAREGIRFDNAFLTASTCTPSRASILTGQYPFRAGAPRLHAAIPAGRTLLSQHLKQAGYFTASVGKWHLGEAVKNQFDLVIEERVTPDESQTGMEDWLPVLQQQLPAGQPFFLWLAAKDAHKPWFPDPAWSRHRGTDMAIPAYTTLNKTQDPHQFKQEMALYYDEIYRADFHIGQVLAALQQKHRLDNTVIILMSDNGAPFWKAKRFLSEAGLKTPLIVYGPGRISGRPAIGELVSAVDLAPTVLQLAKLPVPADMEGYSFAPWLTGSAVTPIRDFVYAERGDELLGSKNGRSLRDKHYLYIKDDYDTYSRCSEALWRNPLRGEQLYDVVRDPDNRHNLAETPSLLQRFWSTLHGQDHRERLQHYRQLMQNRRQQRQDVPAPVINGDCPVAWVPTGNTHP